MRALPSLLIFSLILFSVNLTSSFGSEKLRLIGDQNFKTGEKFKNTEVGGLSGLAFDQEKNKLLAISDDRSIENDARFYEFDLKLDEKTFSVTLADVVILKNKEKQAFKKKTIDFEGIAFYNGDLLITSEGILKNNPPINPELIQFSRLGEYKNNIEIPLTFLPQKENDIKWGARDNLVFEGLSVTPDGKKFWLGTEESLYQDGKAASSKDGSFVRLIEYKENKAGKEIAYPLEKIANIKIAGLTVGSTGLSDILFIDDNHFYSIERCYMSLARKVIVKIFKNTISAATTDISQMDSIHGKKIIPVQKELIANFDDFMTQMSPKFQTIDNIEGIAFGPTLPNTHKTLIFVSDNNFSIFQRTQFLAFEIIP